jgi:hypothetical protein
MNLVRALSISSRVVRRSDLFALKPGAVICLNRSLANARDAPSGAAKKGKGKGESGAALGGEEESMIDHRQIDAFFQAAKDVDK